MELDVSRPIAEQGSFVAIVHKAVGDAGAPRLHASSALMLTQPQPTTCILPSQPLVADKVLMDTASPRREGGTNPGVSARARRRTDH